MTRLAIHMDEHWADQAEVATRYATDICTEARELLGTFLELEPNDLHCCLKVMIASSGRPEDDRVATWARSEPLDDRPLNGKGDQGHLVSRNTVWSALLGRSDGNHLWRVFNCFCCNDLLKHGDKFRCDRENWSRYYRSTLVFPLRYRVEQTETPYRHIGFLAFDSPKIGAFRRLPNIFDSWDEPSPYRNELELRTAFHLGAICADVLGTFLRRAYEDHGHIQGE